MNIRFILMATFMGQDGSLGYKYGCEYLLLAWPEDEGRTLSIREIPGETTGLCPYTPPRNFLRNWVNVKIFDIFDIADSGEL